MCSTALFGCSLVNKAASTLAFFASHRLLCLIRTARIIENMARNASALPPAATLKMGEALSNLGCHLGTSDKPGFVKLPEISPLLSVGNHQSAAHGSWDTVVSTCSPLDKDGLADDSLSTQEVIFDDVEDPDEFALSRHCIIEGAAIVAGSVGAGGRTLVLCEWGHSQSCAICAAYAVLYRQWTSERAIDYISLQNLHGRSYFHQQPLKNKSFNRIIRQLEAERTSVLADPELWEESNKASNAIIARRKAGLY